MKKSVQTGFRFTLSSYRRRPGLCFCGLLLASLLHAQPSLLTRLQTDFNAYRKEVLREKVYLHTDKSFYLTGETLWFKAYVVDAATRRQTGVSKVVYVELIDNKAKPVMQAMIDNRQSAADGSFALPPSLATGTYVLRAYTAWMKNFGEEHFFQVPLQIINAARRPDWSLLQPTDSVAVKFFPEGGNAVEGIGTKLGFQLTNQYGEGVDGDGVIVKNGSDTVAHFRPLKFGIGSVDFTPQTDAVYKAIVRLPNGTKITGALPVPYKQGYVLRVAEADNGEIKADVSTNKPFREKPCYLLVHTRDKITLASAKLLVSGKAGWAIRKDSLSDGINVFTFFDDDGEPVCERLYFKRPSQRLTVEVKSDANNYARRSKVSLALGTFNNSGNAVQSHLSLSVFLLDSLQGPPQSAIEEYLWLTSELKGRIQSPGFYFEKEDAETGAALDNLLLTQGWRRFVWGDIAARRNPFSFLPDYEGPTITGKVINRRTGNAAANVLCYLSAPGEKFYTGNAVSTAGGEVRFAVKDVYGPAELAVQTAGADSTFSVNLQSPYSLDYASLWTPRFALPEKNKRGLAARYLDAQVADAFSGTETRNFYLPALTDTLPFYGRADTRYNLDEYTRFPSMEEVMREITAEVHVNKEKDGFRYSVLNLPYRTYFSDPPLVLFDGVPVTNTDRIIGFDPLKVKRIDVTARKYFWGNTVTNGIISYMTYDGNLSGFALDPGVELVEYNGLQVKREFYSPSYAAPESRHSPEPDKRNVLLWISSVTTDAKNKADLSFYTSDVPGRYAVNVQGLGGDGLAGSKTIVVDVR